MDLSGCGRSLVFISVIKMKGIISPFIFTTNHSSFWILAQKSTMQLRQNVLKILDEHGAMRLSIFVSTLISVAGISNAEECDATIAGIRSFEVNNIWSILESVWPVSSLMVHPQSQHFHSVYMLNALDLAQCCFSAFTIYLR